MTRFEDRHDEPHASSPAPDGRPAGDAAGLGPDELLTAYALGELEGDEQAFLRLCREDRASLDGHLREWLFTVCRHRAMDVHRKERRMRQPDTTLPDPATAPEADPSARLARRETTHRALALLATLPERQQEVLRLRFQEGLSYREIAGVQQLTVSHVGVLIHNAMKTLRARLADARPA